MKKPSNSRNLEEYELYDDGGFDNKDWCIVGIVASSLFMLGGSVLAYMGRSCTKYGVKYKGGNINYMSKTKFEEMMANYDIPTGGMAAQMKYPSNKMMVGGGVGLAITGAVGLAGSIYHYCQE